MKEIEYRGSKYILRGEVNNVFFYDAANDVSEFEMIVICKDKIILEITTDNYYNASWLVVKDHF